MGYIENIKRVRDNKRVSQTDMAEKLGIAQNNYGRIERGLTELTVDRLYKIAEILEVSVADLLEIPIITPANNYYDIKELLRENEQLKDKGQILDKIRNSYLKVFNEHISGVRNEIQSDDNNYNLSIIDKRLFLETEKAAFYLFLKIEKAEWYELAIKYKLIIDEQIVGYWERFKFINPLYFTVSEIENYKSLVSSTNDNSDSLTSMIRYRAKSEEYSYLDKEVTMIMDWYQSFLPKLSKDRMQTKRDYSRLGVSAASDIGRVIIEKLKKVDNAQNYFIDSDKKDGSTTLEGLFQKLHQESMEELSKKIDEEFERLKNINGR